MSPRLWHLVTDRLLQLLAEAGIDRWVPLAFADDLYILIGGETIEQIQDQAEEALRVVDDWSQSSQQPINQAKSEIILMSQKNTDQSKLLEVRWPSSAAFLKAVTVMNILGVHCDQMLTFTKHLQHVTPLFLNRLKLLQHLHAASWGPSLPLLLTTGRATAIGLLQHALPIWFLEPWPNALACQKVHLTIAAGLRQVYHPFGIQR
eukprot:5164914-Amphidinium_carterae.1